MEPLDYDRDPRVRGPFETLALLGQGGMGRAYLARRLPLDGWDGSWEAAYRIADADAVSMGENSLAVLKTIRTELLTDDDAAKVERNRARFVAEVDAIRTVVGPRIPAFLGASPEAAEPWLAMEYIAGPSLDTQVKHGGPVKDVGAWAALGLGLVEALESVHGAGLLHRDLKPGNVVLGPNGPVVLDFGLAVLAERQDFSNALTKTGWALGTPAFMPWEQYQDTKHVKASADVYAIGSTLFFTATGRTPYSGIPAPWAPDWNDVPAEFLPLLGRLFAPTEEQRPKLLDVRHELSAMLAKNGLSYEAAARRLADIVATAGLTPELPVKAIAEGPDPQVRAQAQRAVDDGAAPDAPWLDDGLFAELSPDTDLDLEPGEEADAADAVPHDDTHRARYTPTVPDDGEARTAPLPSPEPTKMHSTETADPVHKHAQPDPPVSPPAEDRRRPVTPRPVPRPALKVAERLRRAYAHSGSL
ncbi:serine/threonine protein kinase [Streptomyces enissocaesilis]|uniref:Protein kinase domain-containing protein n=1 Tax=Streptomyces enissocaesilis TaxID=332589 RepID=A0ABN3XMX1_9ACTN